MPHSPSIFISYRIDDTLTQAGRLHQSLEVKLGKGTVFYDKTCIEAGMKWDEVLEEKVGTAQVILVLYKEGKKWLGVDDFGQRRIDDAKDWVRREVETGLSKKKIVIPVLINEAKLPPETALPEPLRPLLKCQGLPIREAFWENDLVPLLKILQEQLNLGDLKRENKQPPIGKHSAIPDFHAYSCDRVEQTDQFQITFYGGGSNRKIRHFYLYGDARQSHESLHERLGRELCGHLLDWESGNYEPATKVLFQHLKPAVHRHPMLYKIEVVKNIFARFFPKMSGKEPVQQKNTADLLDSPLLEGYGPHDMVFTLITMDDANWNKEVTPLAVEAFIEGFLKVELPENAPTFFFFFGIEYQKDNPTKRLEVQEAIQNRNFGSEVLDELQPVSCDDITEWFSRYRKIMVERGKEPREMMEACFGQVKMLDMKDIEIKLLELICLHNRGLAITADALKRQT